MGRIVDSQILRRMERALGALLKLPVRDDLCQPVIQAETRALINRLRFHASTCRASAKLDIFEACQLLVPQVERNETQDINILIRVLGQALDRSPIWYRPGAFEFSFDEQWLAAVLQTALSEDYDSFRFLTHRRIDRSKRRIFAMIVGNTVHYLTK